MFDRHMNVKTIVENEVVLKMATTHVGLDYTQTAVSLLVQSELNFISTN